MIAHLTGVPRYFFETSVVLDVQGVGYQVFTSALTLGLLQQQEGPVSLWIETHVRPESLQLYGFADPQEQEWFRLLGTVQGVGTRMALSLLSSLKPEEVIQAILDQASDRLTQAEGIGPKLATRICHELKGKVAKMPMANTLALKNPSPQLASVWQEAGSALGHLGYGRGEVQQVLDKIRSQEGELPLDQLIRQGLRYLSQGVVA
ncbi:MAG: Holliday junction branch migration protein RuvA [Alphaproteobacteria bacterium]